MVAPEGSGSRGSPPIAYTLQFIIDRWKRNTFDAPSGETSSTELFSDVETDRDIDETSVSSSSSSGEEIMPKVIYYTANENAGRFVNNLDEGPSNDERHDSALDPRQINRLSRRTAKSKSPRKSPVKHTHKKPKPKQ